MTLCDTSAGMVMIPGNIQVLRKMATLKRYLDPDHMLTIGPDIYGGQLRMNREMLDIHDGVVLGAEDLEDGSTVTA